MLNQCDSEHWANEERTALQVETVEKKSFQFTFS